MKFRKTRSSTIISVLLVIAVLLVALFLRVSVVGLDTVRSLVQSFIPRGEGGLTITMDGMDSTLMKKLKINGIHVDGPNGQNVASIESAEVSLNLFSLAKLALGFGDGDVDINILNANVLVNQQNVDLIMDIVRDFTPKESDADVQDVQSGSTDLSENGGVEVVDAQENKKNPLDLVGINLNVTGLSIDVDYFGIKAQTEGVNARLRMENGLVFSSFDLNAPEIFASHEKIAENLMLTDVRVSVNQDFVAYISVDKANYGADVEISQSSAILALKDNDVSVALHVENLNGAVSIKNFDASACASDITANGTYSLIDNKVGFNASVQKLQAKSKSFDSTAVINALEVEGTFDSENGLSMGVKSSEIELQKNLYLVKATSIGADVGFIPNDLSSIGQITLANARIAGLESYGLKDLNLKEITLDYSYSEAGIGARVKAEANGYYDNNLVENFLMDLDVSAQINSSMRIKSVDAYVKNIRLKALKSSADIHLTLDQEGEIAFEIKNDQDINAVLNYNKGQVDLSLFLSELVPYSYSNLYESVLKNVSVLGKDTMLNGNLVVSAKVSEDTERFIGEILRGNYNTKLEIDKIYDVIQSARVSMNTAIKGLLVGDKSYSGALTAEVDVLGHLIAVNSFAISTGNFRLAYNGTLDIAELIPDGKFVLQNASNGSELARIEFSHERGMRTYQFNLSSPLLDNASVFGVIDWQNLNYFKVIANLQSDFFSDKVISVEATASISPLKISVVGKYVSLDVEMTDQGIVAFGEVSGLGIRVSENLTIVVDSGLSVAFNTSDKSYNVALSALSAKLSNGLGFGMDIKLTSTSLDVRNVSITTAKKTDHLDGSLSFKYSDIIEILHGDTHSLDGVIDFSARDFLIPNATEEGLSYLKASAVDNQFMVDALYNLPDYDLSVKIDMVGQRNMAFYTKVNVKWGTSNLNLNVLYNDSVIEIYDSEGNLGSLIVEDINLMVDFSKVMMNGSLKFSNEKQLKIGDVVSQSGTIKMSARLQSIKTGLLQILSGQDYSMDFTLGLSDVKLADGYSVKDTDIDITLSPGRMSLSGNTISGHVDLKNKYLDVDIENGSLISLKAYGYFGKELNLRVYDIMFPLPVLNQFIDVPSISFRDGIITGDVLIQGDITNPRFYGMAYCQSYEMTLFFLPDQILTVKNVAVYLNGHEMTISKTPMSGYSEADGRYFTGDVSVSLVMQSFSSATFMVRLNIDEDTPIDFWYPNTSGVEFEVRGDVTGFVEYGLAPGLMILNTDIGVSSATISFRIEREVPEWKRNGSGSLMSDMDIKLTTGHDVEFYYPEKDNFFINFTLAEDKTVELINKNNKFTMQGEFALKTGQVYYLHNDFIIRDGHVNLTDHSLNPSSLGFNLELNLTADITDYDADGNKVVITMILQNATLDDITPRFTSTPMMEQNEILAMLGQSVLTSSALDQGLSISSVASFAATATDALTKVGILDSNKSYSISNSVRNSLGLDIFSIRSNIISNVIIDALPGQLAGSGNLSMLARYLDSTSLFAGKYITPNTFIKIRLMLKAEKNIKSSSNVGHFLARDLVLDTEVSIDWDTPMGTVSIFTNPSELSVFDILDTIGFSVTKQIQF